MAHPGFHRRSLPSTRQFRRHLAAVATYRRRSPGPLADKFIYGEFKNCAQGQHGFYPNIDSEISTQSVDGTPPPSPRSELGERIHRHWLKMANKLQASDVIPAPLASKFPGIEGVNNQDDEYLMKGLIQTDTIPKSINIPTGPLTPTTINEHQSTEDEDSCTESDDNTWLNGIEDEITSCNDTEICTITTSDNGNSNEANTSAVSSFITSEEV